MFSNLEPLRTAIAQAIDGMAPQDFLRHPEGKWSTADILDHLNLTYLGTAKNLERCLASGQRRASLDRSSKRWQRIVVTKLGFVSRGGESPESARPRGLPPEQVKTEVLENLRRMEAIIRECEARFGGRKPVADHPILGPLTVNEWRRFHLAHGKHHLKQILRLRQS